MNRSLETNLNKQLDIVKVAQQLGMELSSTGGAILESLCPFHPETTPSFKIYTHNNTWHTFCCNKGGGPVRLIAEVRGLSVEQVIQQFSGKLSLAISRDALATGTDTREIVLRTKIYTACALVRDLLRKHKRPLAEAEELYRTLNSCYKSEDISNVIARIQYNTD